MPEDNPKKLFVAMPYEEREGFLDIKDLKNKIKIDFDSVWKGILAPAIPSNFIAKPAKLLQESGIIDQIYIEWLLEADVVLADLTFHNPNVYYEVGIRQTLSKKGTVLVAQNGTKLPFDLASQNVLNYDYFNASTLRQFQDNLTERINAALYKQDSPVHIFLPGLFVKRYEHNNTPDFIIEKLSDRVAELESDTAKLKNRELVERTLRNIQNTDNSNQLLRICIYELKNTAPSIQVLEILAIKLRKTGRVKEALELLKRANDIFPKDFEILRELGFCCRKLGEDHT